MGGFETLIGSLGLSFVSGINLYATILVVGAGQHFGLITGLPDELAILSSPWVIAVAGVMYLLEFFADKIPFVNTVWDGIHTVIRPLGAALLALAATRDLGPVTQVLSMLVGGSVALGSHATKASFRALANTAPEPATQSVISVAEDIGVVGLLALTYSYPVAALVVFLVLITGMVIVTPLLLRTLHFFGRSLYGILRNLFSDRLSDRPYWLVEHLEKASRADDQAIPAYARSLDGVPRMRFGWLCWGDDGYGFIYKRTIGVRSVEISDVDDPEIAVERRLLCDVLYIRRKDGSSRRVFLPKDSAKAFGRPSPRLSLTPQPGPGGIG